MTTHTASPDRVPAANAAASPSVRDDGRRDAARFGLPIHPPPRTVDGQPATFSHPLADASDALDGALGVDLAPDGPRAPRFGVVSPTCTRWLGLDAGWADAPGAADVVGARALWVGTRPFASVYSGHQFGVWAGQLGDGRAISMGSLATPDGDVELQWKGAGLTPYSRMGDGRAVLRSTVREFLASEAMAALGIPTTRALAFTTSDAPVRRETVETAAVVVRAAPSFLRFGHFEHFAHDPRWRDDARPLRALVDFVVARHVPALADAPSRPLALLGWVTARTAELVAAWQSVGFAHGVMNTDNLSILGLTIDYGPYGFLDGFDAGHVCNHSDTQARYAFGAQPQVAWWNLHALAQALLPLLDGAPPARVDAVRDVLATFRPAFADAMGARLAAKLGLREWRGADDEALAADWFTLLGAHRTDHTLAWRALGEVDAPDDDDAPRSTVPALHDLVLDRAALDAWLARWRERVAGDGRPPLARRRAMHAVNPRHVLRNHLAERAIRDAAQGAFDTTARLAAMLARPFEEQPDAPAEWTGLPPAWAGELVVSCSS